TLGHLFGRMQRYVNDVKADISREMELDELKKMRASMEDTARSFQSSVNQGVSETEKEMSRLAQDTQSAMDAYTEAPASAPPAAPAVSPQGELPLESGKPPPIQKQS